MTKVAYLFPGQGSQYVGMGKALWDAFPAVRNRFAQAEEIVGSPLGKLIFEGPEDELRQTRNSQPAIFLISVVCWELLEQRGARFEGVAGHSLGEYCALVAAGVLEFEPALRLVKERGRLMDQMAEGTMAAVLGLSEDKVKSACREARATGHVEVANLNCPDQTVISGSLIGVAKASELAKSAGATRVIPLNVSGAFHSALMSPAAESFAGSMDHVEFSRPGKQFIANVTANFESDPSEIRRLLIEQIRKPVLWEATVRRFLSDGYGTFVEVGPGNVLRGTLKRIDRKVGLLGVEDPSSLEATAKALTDRAK